MTISIRPRAAEVPAAADATAAHAGHARPVTAVRHARFVARLRRGLGAAAGITLAAVAALPAGCTRGTTVADTPAAPLAAPTAGIVAPPGSPRTVVSLTFDDGNWSQYRVFPQMVDLGLRGTFYVNTGLVDRGDASVMTWDQLRRLAVAGNDIGGHTRDHADLPKLPVAEEQVEVCEDREQLIVHGFDPVDFAYPYGDHAPATETVVRSCGYRTARLTGGLGLTRPAETAHPGNPYTISSVTGSAGPVERGSNRPLTTEFLESSVQAAAAHGGGWVPLVFHMICKSSDPDYQRCMATDAPTDYAVFSDFLNWLTGHAPPGTVVETVKEATAS